jgi:hypothetical protein
MVVPLVVDCASIPRAHPPGAARVCDLGGHSSLIEVNYCGAWSMVDAVWIRLVSELISLVYAVW